MDFTVLRRRKEMHLRNQFYIFVLYDHFQSISYKTNLTTTLNLHYRLYDLPMDVL